MKNVFSRSLLITAAWFSLALANSLPSSEFVVQAIKGDNSEIMLGRFVINHGASAGVIRFGRVLINDRIKAREQMVVLAKTMDITPPTDITSEASNEQIKLLRLNGEILNREFSAYIVNDHEHELRNFEAEAMSDKGTVSALAAMQLPSLRKDLRLAKAL